MAGDTSEIFFDLIGRDKYSKEFLKAGAARGADREGVADEPLDCRSSPPASPSSVCSFGCTGRAFATPS
jgi:hypothetical protein